MKVTSKKYEQNASSTLARLGLAEIVEHYEKIFQDLTEQPILIGHSFGGLIVQILLDNGFGKAGVAIDGVPPRGVRLVLFQNIKVYFQYYQNQLAA